MKNEQFARDLGQDLQRRLGELLQRQTTIAAQILDPADLAIMLMEVAVSTLLTAAATIAAQSKDGEAEAQFDRVIAGIGVIAAGDRDRALAAIAKQKASRR